MQYDKIYAGICGYNRKTNKRNRPKKPGNLGIVTVFGEKRLGCSKPTSSETVKN